MDLKHFSGLLKATSAAKAGGFSAIITTPQVDEDGESVDPRGLVNRDAYMTNPQVFWAHEWAYRLNAEPIAKATRLDVFNDRIESDAEFAPTAKAQNIRALVEGGFVSRTSVGFEPLQMKMVQGIPTHTQWAMKEYSIVPLPANNGATITGIKSALSWLADEGLDPGKLAAEGLTLHAPEYGVVTVHDGQHEIAKATWSTQYVDDLPNSAFACVQGKQRYYPHHSASGALDLPHLRAALSRIGDPDNQQCGKAHLEAHAKAALGKSSLWEDFEQAEIRGTVPFVREKSLLILGPGESVTIGYADAATEPDADDQGEVPGQDGAQDFGMEEQQEAAPVQLARRRVAYLGKGKK